MYNNKLAACIKVAGRVLREQNDIVNLPFGAEYSVFLKNLDTVKILAKVEIDGQDVGDGTQFIVPANGSINIERFIKNGNFNEGNKLKFIERSAGVEKHRGIQCEDGLLRIEFQFEQRVEKQVHNVYHQYNHHYPYYPYYYYPYYNNYPDWYTTTTFNSELGKGSCSGFSGSSVGASSYSVNNMTETGGAVCDSATPVATACSGGSAAAAGPSEQFFTSNGISSASNNTLRSRSLKKGSNVNLAQNAQVNDAGITVPGSLSSQQFQYGDYFPVEEQKHVIILKLLGQTETGTLVQRPVTVKRNVQCTSCGQYNKQTASFCSGCGSSVVIY